MNGKHAHIEKAPRTLSAVLLVLLAALLALGVAFWLPSAANGAADPDALSANDRAANAPATLVASDGTKYADGQVILTLRDGADQAAIGEALARAGVDGARFQTVSQAAGETFVLLTYASGQDPNEVLGIAQACDGVLGAEVDHVLEAMELGAVDAAALSRALAALDDDTTVEPIQGVEPWEDGADEDPGGGTASDMPNDPSISNQWGLEAIGAFDAWKTVKAQGSVTVALIDTGVAATHPDLKDNLLLDYAIETTTMTTGAQAVNDQAGHGTHVAGIVAAVANNGLGVAGVTYNAKVLPVKASKPDGSNSFTESAVAAAVTYVVDKKTASDSPAALKNIRVMNMSIGTDVNLRGSALDAAIQRAHAAGILVVASAGNAGDQRNNYPAALDNVLAVTSVQRNADGSLGSAASSNTGPFVDVAAPGVDIYSTVNTKATDGSVTSYGNKSGTSMASPLAAGAAALLFVRDPSLTPAQVSAILEQTAQDLGDAGDDDVYGWGVIQIDKALQASSVPTDVSGWKAYCTLPGSMGIVEVGTATAVLPYTGRAIKLDGLSVGPDATHRVDASQFTVKYSDNTVAGTARVTLTGDDRTYCGACLAEFTIDKATYDMSGVTFANETVTYNGEEHSLMAVGLPDGVTVAYEGNGKTEIGTYTVTATFTGADTVNHYAPTPAQMTATLKIVPKTYDATFDLTGIASPGAQMWIDGIPYAMEVSGTKGTVRLPDSSAKVATLYAFAKSSGADPEGKDAHLTYPSHMYVWKLTGNSDGPYTVQRLSALDDLLQYGGSAIRVTGKYGIRMITGMPQAAKASLKSSGGLAGYTLEETGTVLGFASNFEGADITLGAAKTASGTAYVRGKSDSVYKTGGGLEKYTNVLVDITTAKCSDDLAMRPYAKLKDKASGAVITVYGGTVYRSIGYIAYQNKDAFAKGTNAYTFIRGILNAVYPGKF